MRKPCKSRAPRGRRRLALKRADAEVLQIQGPQIEEKRANNRSGCRGYTKQGPAEGLPTIKRADAEPIQIKGLQREEKGDNKESRYKSRGCGREEKE